MRGYEAVRTDPALILLDIFGISEKRKREKKIRLKLGGLLRESSVCVLLNLIC